MWTEFITNMPRGAAIMDSSGLMRGGRRGWYWGGALLMLLADVEIRRASDGRLGLEDCLRAIRMRIGNYARAIGLNEMTSACDRAVGGTVLAGLIERHAQSATPMDLQGLWRALGVQLVNGVLKVDDGAPLAEVRQAIVRGGPVNTTR
jgi:predicted metalloprotease with PDZ domain